MNRKIPALWLLPTLLLGLDLGWRFSNYHGPSIRAQQPALTAAPNAATESDLLAVNDVTAAYEKFQPVNQAFQMVSRALAPSVVHIVARKPSGEEGEIEESGSGVIIATGHEGQYIMTNNHVVQDAKPRRIRIQLADGRVISPELVWTDAKADIAIMKLPKSAPKLVPAKLGNSDEVIVGTWVMAMGSPFGLMHSVSQGIISARGRHEAELFQDGVENQDFLQTDAAINPGNSGGPLVNLKGEVIGINTAIASQGGGSEGVGFTIPINLARWIMDQLLTNGKVQRGALGIDLDELSANRAQELGLEQLRGAIVTGVHPDSPAFHAGLKSQDIIVQFNKVQILDLNHLINVVSMAPIGKLADVVIWRNQKPLQIKVKVGPRDTVLATETEIKPNVESQVANPENEGQVKRPQTTILQGPWGLTVRDLTAKEKTVLGQYDRQQGTMIVKIEESSPLVREIVQGDIITSLNGRSFGSAQALMNNFNQLITGSLDDSQKKSQKSIEIEVLRTKSDGDAQSFILRVDL